MRLNKQLSMTASFPHLASLFVSRKFEIVEKTTKDDYNKAKQKSDKEKEEIKCGKVSSP